MAAPRASEERNCAGNHGHGGGAVIIQGVAAARVAAVVMALWDSKCAGKHGHGGAVSTVQRGRGGAPALSSRVVFGNVGKQASGGCCQVQVSDLFNPILTNSKCN
jgi:hypothetical protein